MNTVQFSLSMYMLLSMIKQKGKSWTKSSIREGNDLSACYNFEKWTQQSPVFPAREEKNGKRYNFESLFFELCGKGTWRDPLGFFKCCDKRASGTKSGLCPDCFQGLHRSLASGNEFLGVFDSAGIAVLDKGLHTYLPKIIRHVVGRDFDHHRKLYQVEIRCAKWLVFLHTGICFLPDGM